MYAAQAQFDILAIQAAWQALDAVTHLRPIYSEEEYDRMVMLLNSLLDAAGNDEDHALSGLLELVGDLVFKYEQEHYAITPVEPKDFEKFSQPSQGWQDTIDPKK